ncbi:hypothetical protein LTR53_000742 [Teratosphaeriaceae sp. CCFEE 6253]|nr:hypothetical protein LTR53_000742 [Teratosphaeriaceae sp. CCFEE 6253]
MEMFTACDYDHLQKVSAMVPQNTLAHTFCSSRDGNRMWARLLSPSLKARRMSACTATSELERVPRSMTPMSPIQTPSMSPIKSPIKSPRHGPVESTELSPVLSPLRSPWGPIVSEEEILATPLDDSHKELALKHHRRLMRIASTEDPPCRPMYTTPGLAREQLARMTLVIRDFMKWYRAQPEMEEVEVVGESVIVDIIDACLHVPGLTGNWLSPAFHEPLADGRERAIATMLQESFHSNPDDLSRHTDLEPFPEYKETVVPDYTRPPHWLGADLDWNRDMRRTFSDSDMLHFGSIHPVHVEEMKQSRAELDRSVTAHKEGRWQDLTKRRNVVWPPTGRSRSSSDAYNRRIDWVEIRRVAAMQSLANGRAVGDEKAIALALKVLENPGLMPNGAPV